MAFADWSRFAAPDIEGLFRQRSGAIPLTAAERREKRCGICEARGTCLRLGAAGVGVGVGLYGYAGDICDYGGLYYGTSYCGGPY